MPLHGIVKNWSLIEKPSSSFYEIYDNFFYVLVSFAFHFQKDFHGVHEIHYDTDAFFLFRLLKDFDILHFFFAFCFFILRKDFNTFHKPIFEAFLCFSENIQQSFLYIPKKYLIHFSYTQNH